MSKGSVIAAGVALLLTGVVIALVPVRSEVPRPEFAAPTVEAPESRADVQREGAYRALALALARVWKPTDPSVADLDSNPVDPSGYLSGDIVRCRFVPHVAGGTTPKFRCALPDGEVVKVKYGSSGEVPAEVAGSRLLTALGFAADQVYLVPQLRCYGCPNLPFHAMRALDRIGMADAMARALPQSRFAEFRWVVVERHAEGNEIVTPETEGWGWFELPPGEADDDGRRAERDALRLLARFLAHWDNKTENQRLVCQSTDGDRNGPCAAPLAFIQDLGSTFGPKKMELESWKRVAIWQDRIACRVSMRDLPYGGGTFADATISEAGRLLLARQLTKLDVSQVEALFLGARVEEFKRGPVVTWVRVFNSKVVEVASGPPCPN